jgi:hypothetical protein
MLANHGKEDGIYSHTTIEIATAQKKDHQIYSKKNAKKTKVDLSFQLIEDTIVLYKDENQTSQHLYGKGISWYHHYLQHPSHSCLKEIMRSMIYWKGIHNTI